MSAPRTTSTVEKAPGTFHVPGAFMLFSACPLLALARSSFGWSYTRWLRCTMPGARVMDAGLVSETGDSNPKVPPRHRPSDWFAKPVVDASMFREPTPLLTFATTREDVGYLLENRGPAKEPRGRRLALREIGRRWLP
jgi:hypothetical protein